MSVKEENNSKLLDYRFFLILIIGAVVVLVIVFFPQIEDAINEHYHKMKVEQIEREIASQIDTSNYEVTPTLNQGSGLDWDCGETMQYGTYEECQVYWDTMSMIMEEQGRFAMLKQLDDDGHLSNYVKLIIRDIEGIHLPLKPEFSGRDGLDLSVKISDSYEPEVVYYEVNEMELVRCINDVPYRTVEDQDFLIDHFEDIEGTQIMVMNQTGLCN